MGRAGLGGGASDIVNVESSGEDPRALPQYCLDKTKQHTPRAAATGGIVSNFFHLWFNKTKQHTLRARRHDANDSGSSQFLGSYVTKLDVLHPKKENF